MYYTIYQSTRDSREIIVEAHYMEKDMLEVQKEILNKGYLIKIRIDDCRFKAVLVEKEEEDNAN